MIQLEYIAGQAADNKPVPAAVVDTAFAAVAGELAVPVLDSKSYVPVVLALHAVHSIPEKNQDSITHQQDFSRI